MLAMSFWNNKYFKNLLVCLQKALKKSEKKLRAGFTSHIPLLFLLCKPQNTREEVLMHFFDNHNNNSGENRRPDHNIWRTREKHTRKNDEG
jgi:hypothetical protein